MMKLFENDVPDHFISGDEIAIDTETMGLKPHRDRLCVVQLSNKQKDVTLIQFKDGKFKAPNLVKILNDPKVLKIFHYARFDVATLLHHLPHVDIKNIFCTKIASHIVRTYTDRHGLKALVRELLNLDLDKSEQTSYWGAPDLTERQKEYAAADVIHLCRLKDILSSRLKREGRYEIALECFDFIQTRAKLDLLFGEEVDVFSYKLGKTS